MNPTLLACPDEQQGDSTSNLDFIINSYTQNIEGNYSDITWRVRVRESGKQATLYGSALEIDGTQRHFSSTTLGYSAYSDGYVRASGTTRIYHNADGTKQFTVKLKQLFYYGWTTTRWGGNQYYMGDTSYTEIASMTVTAPTIPRASTPSASNGTIGSTVPISIARASTSFTHTLKATFGGVTDTIATGVATSYNWTPSLSIQSRIPSATSGNCIITCETYSGSTLIGTKTVTISLGINTASCTPDLTGSYVDLNTAITAVTGSNTLLISGLSNARITAAPTLKYGATIASIKIGGVNVVSGGSPYKRDITAVTAASYLLEVTDSRGLYKSYTRTLSYAAYSAITFLASFFRTAAMNNEIALQFSGTFYNSTIGTTTNTLTARYRFQPELGEWSEWQALTVSVSGNNFSNVGEQVVLGTNFDHNKQYMFEIEFLDALDIKTNTILVRAGRTILKVTEFVQVLQGKLHIQKLFTKNDKDFVFDFVYDIITRAWILHVYGLTQMFEPQHMFQADVNARSIITVLNEGTYPLLKYTIDDSADNFVDYKNLDEVADYNNYQMIDTGICALTNILEKRVRELQFTTFNSGASNMAFYVTAYVDSRNVSSPEDTTIDWISDPEDPNYGQLYEIEEEVANVYGETNLEEWLIDYSQFPKTGLVKSHLSLHGKGSFLRVVIVNRDMIEHELSGITWVYRIMNAR